MLKFKPVNPNPNPVFVFQFYVHINFILVGKIRYPDLFGELCFNFTSWTLVKCLFFSLLQQMHSDPVVYHVKLHWSHRSTFFVLLHPLPRQQHVLVQPQIYVRLAFSLKFKQFRSLFFFFFFHWFLISVTTHGKS